MFSFPVKGLGKFCFLIIPSVQNTIIIIGNAVYILSDTDDVVQKVGFEKEDPAFCGGGGPLGRRLHTRAGSLGCINRRLRAP